MPGYGSVPMNKGNMKLGKRRKAKAMKAIAERPGAAKLGAMEAKKGKKRPTPERTMSAVLQRKGMVNINIKPKRGK